VTLFLGVDAGGTRTRAALVDGQGELLALGAAGPGNWVDQGEERLLDALALAWRSAWEALGSDPRPIDGVFLGIAGLSACDRREVLAELLAARGFAERERIGADHDLCVAQAGAHALGPGLVLVAGTGSACYGRDAEGREARAGGHGHMLDDGGSAADLGRRALAACLRAVDGRGPQTGLEDTLLEALGLSSLRALSTQAQRGALDRLQLAELAPHVTRAAAAGDPAALAVIEAGAEELALAAGAVAHRLGLDDPQVALVGGLTQAGDVFVGPVAAALGARLPGARLVPRRLAPVLGAALLAMGLAAQPPEQAVIRRLESQGID